jgi:hypothetical protein
MSSHATPHACGCRLKHVVKAATIFSRGRTFILQYGHTKLATAVPVARSCVPPVPVHTAVPACTQPYQLPPLLNLVGVTHLRTMQVHVRPYLLT